MAERNATAKIQKLKTKLIYIRWALALLIACFFTFGFFRSVVVALKYLQC